MVIIRILFVALSMLISCRAYAQFADTPIYLSQVEARNASVGASDSSKKMADTTCGCHPSLPLEIATSSLTVGLIEWWWSRGFFDDTSLERVGPGLIVPSLLLYMVTLAPIAEWTSGCVANSWNTVWIGAISHAVCILGYGAAYGFSHVLNFDRFYWPEYVAIGVAPTVITSLWYNIFLHSRPKDEGDHRSDQGMYLLPSVNGDKSVALNFGMRF